MADKNRVADKSTMHRYRIELPILIDDLDLSVYEFRLYVRFKRRSGDGGSCWEGARALAKACGMSAGQVAKAKKGLENKGLIRVGTKQTRGGQTDDITLTDIWPQNFKTYASEESDRVVITSPESDHHTITLNGSDHQAIASPESDQDTITLTSKRSPGDRKNHDQYHIESDSNTPTPTARERKKDVGAGVSIFTGELIERGMNPNKAAEIASSGYDRPTVLESLDNMLADGKAANRDCDQTIGNFINRLKLTPPEIGKPYARQRAAPKGEPLQATRPNVPDNAVSPAEVARRMRESR